MGHRRPRALELPEPGLRLHARWAAAVRRCQEPRARLSRSRLPVLGGRRDRGRQRRLRGKQSVLLRDVAGRGHRRRGGGRAAGARERRPAREEVGARYLRRVVGCAADADRARRRGLQRAGRHVGVDPDRRHRWRRQGRGAGARRQGAAGLVVRRDVRRMEPVAAVDAAGADRQLDDQARVLLDDPDRGRRRRPSART